MAYASFDVELALTAPQSLTPSERAQLQSAFVVEEKLHSGWGVVVRAKPAEGIHLDRLVARLVESALPFGDSIKRCKPVLRIAAFNQAATCTFEVDELAAIGSLGATLEISVYPAT